MFKLVLRKISISMLILLFVGAVLSCTIWSFGALFANDNHSSHTAGAGHSDNHFIAHSEVLSQMAPVGASSLFEALLLMASLFVVAALILNIFATNPPVLQAQLRHLWQQSQQIRFLARRKILSFLAQFELSPSFA